MYLGGLTALSTYVLSGLISTYDTSPKSAVRTLFSASSSSELIVLLTFFLLMLLIFILVFLIFWRPGTTSMEHRPALPSEWFGATGWGLFLEHRPFAPAIASCTVWGSGLGLAQATPATCTGYHIP